MGWRINRREKYWGGEAMTKRDEREILRWQAQGDLGWNPASNSEGGKGFLLGRFRRGEGLCSYQTMPKVRFPARSPILPLIVRPFDDRLLHHFCGQKNVHRESFQPIQRRPYTGSISTTRIWFSNQIEILTRFIYTCVSFSHPHPGLRLIQ